MIFGLPPVIGTALSAATAMYLFDPERGRRRRALLRDKFISSVYKFENGFGTFERDFIHRARGVIASMRSVFINEPVPDEILIERVRAKMGRVVSHPGAIQVKARQGRVTLEGDILEREYKRLLRTVWSVPGVADIRDWLGIYKSSAGVPTLQGGRPKSDARLELMQKNWSPTLRVLTGVAGGALVFNGLRKREFAGLIVGVIGAAIVLRSATNKPVTGLLNVKRCKRR